MSALEDMLPPDPGAGATGAYRIDDVEPAKVDQALRDRLPNFVLRRLDEGDVDDRSEASHSLVAAAVECGLTDAEVLGLAAAHRPTISKADERGVSAADYASMSLSKVRADHPHAGRRCIDVECQRAPDWQRKKKADQDAQAAFFNFNGKSDTASASGEEVPPSDALEPYPMQPIGAWCRLVDESPPPAYLIRRLIVAGDYGVFGAAKKLGKSMLSLDMALSVASGAPFLGGYEVDTVGPVVLFVGEGGKRKLVRRARAVAESKGISLEDLPLYVYERAPKLASLDAVARLEVTLEQYRPVLTIIDPAYLAVSGAKTSDLTAMGELLERAQFVTQAVGSALLMIVHWNKTGQGSSADRFTGAGWSEWGRFLISGEVISKRLIDKATGKELVLVRSEVVGDETPDTTITYRRTMWADDPDDLSSAMHYEVDLIDEDEALAPTGADPTLSDFKPSVRRVLAALQSRPGEWMGWRTVGDVCADAGQPLKKTTVLDALGQLVGAGLVDVDQTGTNHTWQVSADTSLETEERNVF